VGVHETDGRHLRRRLLSWGGEGDARARGPDLHFGLRVYSGLIRTPPMALIWIRRIGLTLSPTRAWEVARTVVAPPSSIVQCLWGVFLGGVWGVVLVVCVCVTCFSLTAQGAVSLLFL